MKMVRLLTAVYILGILPQAFAVSPRFQEVKIGLWIEGLDNGAEEEEIVLGEHGSKPSFKVARFIPEELSVPMEEKF